MYSVLPALTDSLYHEQCIISVADDIQVCVFCARAWFGCTYLLLDTFKTLFDGEFLCISVGCYEWLSVSLHGKFANEYVKSDIKWSSSHANAVLFIRREIL